MYIWERVFKIQIRSRTCFPVLSLRHSVHCGRIYSAIIYDLQSHTPDGLWKFIFIYCNVRGIAKRATIKISELHKFHKPQVKVSQPKIHKSSISRAKHWPVFVFCGAPTPLPALVVFFYVSPVNNIEHSQKGLMTPVFPRGEMLKLAARILTEAPNISLALLKALIYHFPIFLAVCFQIALLQSVMVLRPWD